MKKKIVINNINDYNKFLKKLFWYKRIIFYNTFFEVETNIYDENIKWIVEALNIKKRKDRITYIYDKSCEIIDKNVDNKNICGFKNNKCYVQRKLNNNTCNGCCRKCLYQSQLGCTTKNLSCKLFYCSEVTKRFKVIEYKDLKILKILSLKNRLLIKSDLFSKREDVLKDLYSYSLIYSSLRIIFRLFNYKKRQLYKKCYNFIK